MVHDVLGEDHALGAAETAESRRRRLGRLADDALGAEVLPVVAVVDVEECAFQNARRQIFKSAAVGIQSNVQRHQRQRRRVHAGRVVAPERVAAARSLHVNVAFEAQVHRRLAQLRRRRRRHRGEERPRLFAAEAAAHALRARDDLVLGYVADVRHVRLRLGDGLRRGDDVEAAVFEGRGAGRVALEVKVLLSTDLHRPRNLHQSGSNRGRPRLVQHAPSVVVERFGFDGLVDGDASRGVTGLLL
mmetsp:Transcript_3125/g.9418  ORF Transcript_3125/g.9418 Transcript_3125/m.9418 type:complete len:245 (+) Transcript_3125:1481-2215(+)